MFLFENLNLKINGNYENNVVNEKLNGWFYIACKLNSLAYDKIRIGKILPYSYFKNTAIFINNIVEKNIEEIEDIELKKTVSVNLKMFNKYIEHYKSKYNNEDNTLPPNPNLLKDINEYND